MAEQRFHTDDQQLTCDHVLVPIEVRESTIGGELERSVHAAAPIEAGTIVVVLGGYATPGALFEQLDESRQRHSLQVGDDMYLVCGEHFTGADFINHSCQPNLGFLGDINLVALRDIAAGEELAFDYSMSDSSSYDEFECHCQAPECRGKVTGQDWREPELQARYRGHFSGYLQRKIDAGIE